MIKLIDITKNEPLTDCFFRPHDFLIFYQSKVYPIENKKPISKASIYRKLKKLIDLGIICQDEKRGYQIDFINLYNLPQNNLPNFTKYFKRKYKHLFKKYLKKAPKKLLNIYRPLDFEKDNKIIIEKYIPPEYMIFQNAIMMETSLYLEQPKLDMFGFGRFYSLKDNNKKILSNIKFTPTFTKLGAYNIDYNCKSDFFNNIGNLVSQNKSVRKNDISFYFYLNDEVCKIETNDNAMHNAMNNANNNYVSNSNKCYNGNNNKYKYIRYIRYLSNNSIIKNITLFSGSENICPYINGWIKEDSMSPTYHFYLNRIKEENSYIFKDRNLDEKTKFIFYKILENENVKLYPRNLEKKVIKSKIDKLINEYKLMNLKNNVAIISKKVYKKRKKFGYEKIILTLGNPPIVPPKRQKPKRRRRKKFIIGVGFDNIPKEMRVYPFTKQVVYAVLDRFDKNYRHAIRVKKHHYELVKNNPNVVAEIWLKPETIYSKRKSLGGKTFYFTENIKKENFKFVCDRLDKKIDKIKIFRPDLLKDDD